MALDDLLLHIGEMGRYQWKLFVLVSLGTVVCTVGYFGQIFFTIHTPHWCQVDEWVNENCSEYGYYIDQCEELKRNLSIPMKAIGFAQCEKYNITGIEFDVNFVPFNLSTVDCDDGWVYDTSESGRTLISQFDLVCGRENLQHISQALFFTGGVFSILYGSLSDRYGRIFMWGVAIVHSLVFSTLILLVKNFWLYMILKMLMGAATIACWSIPFVYVTEIVGHKKRMFAGLAIELFWAGNYLMLTSLAWIIQDWIYLEICVICIHVLVLPILCIIPESPRWLIATGKEQKADKILHKIATENGREMPKDYTDILEEDKLIDQKNSSRKQITPLHIFKNPSLCLWTTVFAIIWFANGVTYLGLIYMSGDIGVPFYPSFFISAAVEIPSYICCLILLSCVGRKWPVFGSMMFTGISCIIAIFVQPGVAKSIFVFAAKFTISFSYVVVFVYTTEIYPTAVRGFGLGFCSIMTMLGTIVSPLLSIMGNLWEPFPLLICGALTILGGLLSLFLPETRGTLSPETIEEAEGLGKFHQNISNDDIDHEVVNGKTQC